ncbi:hypothetical protein F4859DRAFT_377957 [Xylaria cf. heliscus]|nr:hypothetical protein F4859DRAFT_377957 [Xylaria cf. heliscus]
MAYQTSSSTPASSDYSPWTYALGSSSESTPDYPLELDIEGTAGSGSSPSGSTDKPIMSYSTNFTPDWRKDYGSSMSTQYVGRATSSTRGNAGSTTGKSGSS